MLANLKIFCDITETGSFSRAAKLHLLTQSAVSQQLKNLEQSLGCVLIGRGHHRMQLTAAGLVFYRTAKKILANYEEMLGRIRTLVRKTPGDIRITTIYSVGTYVLQPYVAGFIRKHPDIHISMDYQKATRIYDDIIRERADLSIMAWPARQRGIEAFFFGTEEMVLICPKRHPLMREPALELRHLAGHDFIAFDQDAPTRKALDRVLREHGVKPAIKMELDNIEIIKSAVQGGAGVAIVPAATVAGALGRRGIHVRRFRGERITRPLYILVKKDRKPSPPAKLFLKYLQSWNGRSPDGLIAPRASISKSGATARR